MAYGLWLMASGIRLTSGVRIGRNFGRTHVQHQPVLVLGGAPGVVELVRNRQDQALVDVVWVATMASYPHWKPKTPMDDKLLIFEDYDHDGRADECKVFAGGLHQPTGFEIGHDLTNDFLFGQPRGDLRCALSTNTLELF